MKRISLYCLLVISCLGFCYLLQGCKKDRAIEYSLSGATKGTWEWVRTTTPTRNITPQTAGYTKQLAVSSDNQGAYIAFYKNDTLQYRFNESASDTAHTFVDNVRQTVLVKYGAAGYIKYNVAVSSNDITLTVSEPLNPFTNQSDTIHSTYKSMNKQLYPY